ncbi:UDP-glucoronosyl and UDP-glucosyl transferase [Clostridium estertheticum]|uniref:glycosyltransferase n=1 Tax=Clostridium estertheticum TaxID=238834 RepID=UPI001C7E02D1|nr:nucleotide disphospho-sugar-binding domain-containing protein [Clostridium estertheticum]MBX4262084.1 UDP-glucoronosyl and UDP-glucosyl transferase [Clostridium estertheticum]WLC68963.1 UDP-glucoronosyl and UDP-glucosyl transferase [Clostridium estertheticum]
MRVLIAPMSAMAETSGPFSRAVALCHKLIERQHEVAFCAAKDVNYKTIENIKNYYAPIPSPLGMPMFIGKRMIKIVQLLGIQQKKSVNSYEQVLHFIGAITYNHFLEDVFYIRKAIQNFKPDVVYAEFRISAIVASKLENVKVVTGFSYPVQKSFASNPEYSEGVKVFIKENKLPSIESVLDIFDWADLKVVPSSYELEPIDDKKIVFTGPFFVPKVKTVETPRNKIIAYMGYGTITPKTVIYNLAKVFEESKFQIYIATEQVKPFKKNNINVDRKFDFSELMPEAVAYINHGGQNSIMTGLIYGVPQIICPGNNFERRYNASSIVHLGAGVSLESGDFNAKTIKKIVKELNIKPIYANNSKKSGERLLNLGGVNKVVQVLEDLIH